MREGAAVQQGAELVGGQGAGEQPALVGVYAEIPQHRELSRGLHTLSDADATHRDDAANIGFSVGYDSPSQFSREYSRLFGAPPARDAARLRGLAGTGALPFAQGL